MMKRAFLTVGILVITITTWSQSYVKARVVGTYDDSSCVNTVVCETYNLAPHSYIDHNTGVPNDIDSLQNGDTLQNFCQYSIANPDHHKLDFYSSNGYLSHFQTYSTAIPDHLNFSFSNYVAPSAPGAQDGSITMIFDSSTVLSNYTFVHFQDNHTPDTTTVDAYTMQLDLLQNGYLTFYIYDPLNDDDHINISIYIGNTEDMYVNTGLNPSFAMQHANGTCDGWILTTSVGGGGTMHNVWHDQAIDLNFRTNLCPGIYSIYHYETVATSPVAGSIDTMVVTNNNMAYIDSSIFTNVPQDTMYFNFANCAFDYNAPIDSISYVEDTVSIVGPVTTIAFTMTMYQDTFYVATTDTMVLLNDSLVMLDVVVYCDAFKSMNFSGRRVAYMRGVEQHNFYQNGVGIVELEEESFNIYPNPATDLINIDCSSEINYQVEMRDHLGRIVLIERADQSSNATFDISDLEKGMYILCVYTGNKHETFRFIKE